jgi:DNA uptake protein ComE-like DNA-binding protein
VVELNKVLLDQKLTAAQARDFYRKAFIPINLNTGTKEEFLLIPGVGPRMSGEFAEYRPWKTWTQFDKEIGKYVGQPETDRLKLYFFIPSV